MSYSDPVAAERPWHDFDRDVRSAKNALRSVTDTLNDLIEEALADKRAGVKDLPVKAAELETALKRAIEIEGKLNDWIADRTGARRAGEFDLAAAWAEIDRRLGGLRGCTGS